MRLPAQSGHDPGPRHAPATPIPRQTPRESVPLRRAARRAQQKSRGWLIALATVVGVIAVAACGAGVWLMVRGDGVAEPDTTASASPEISESPPPSPPQTRDTEAGALTVAELFGADELAGGYTVLEAEELSDCPEAATEELAELLTDGDCSQIVRATVAAPGQEYAATLGVVNLADADAAEDIRGQIEAGDGGGFTALRAGGISEELGMSPTVLGFNTYGHYLLYVVIGRADGESPSSQDDEVADMVGDLVDGYLVETLTERVS